MKKLFLTTLFLAFATTISAQLKNPENELGAWYMYNGSHKVSDKFSIKTMAHFRFFDLASDMRQFIGRLGVNYKINKTVSVTLGYAYLDTDRTFDVDGGFFGDHRVYEDLNVKYKINKLGVAHRLRAEQRFFEGNTGHLVRYQLGLSYPISEEWSTFIYDEVFFDFDGEAYNQNWFGGGFKYKLNDAVKLKFGYQNISINSGPTFNRLLLGVELSTK